MPLSTIIMVVIVVCIALAVFNFIFESFRYIINIVVIIGLVVWILYTLGYISNLPNANGLYDRISNSISNKRH